MEVLPTTELTQSVPTKAPFGVHTGFTIGVTDAEQDVAPGFEARIVTTQALLLPGVKVTDAIS